MPDKFYSPDDPTQPMPPRQYNQQQDKTQYPHQSSQRRPYQNPAQPPQAYPGQQPAYPYSNQPPAQHRQQAEPGYPYQQPGQMQGNRLPLPPKRRQPRRRGCFVGCLTMLILFCIILVFALFTVPRVLTFGSKISTQSPLTTDTNYMNTSDRTNLLIMGYGGGTHAGAYLTDSLLVMSILPQSHHTSLISIPRDLFVQYPPQSGQYGKINSIYENASNNGGDPKAGGEAVVQKISLVTGMNVKYWLTIDFTGFKQVIDSIGGVDVTVPDAFNACYPKNDDAAADPSWIKVQFDKGLQHMDGATAIEYARAREPLEVCGQGTSENLGELTDFGRSARQQIIIKAVLSKVKQLSTWPHLYSAMDALQQTIHTNMSLVDLSAFALKMDLNDPKAAHIGLSNQNVLQDGQSNDGQYILQPTNGDWNAIPPYIQQHLYN